MFQSLLFGLRVSNRKHFIRVRGESEKKASTSRYNDLSLWAMLKMTQPEGGSYGEARLESVQYILFALPLKPVFIRVC